MLSLLKKNCTNITACIVVSLIKKKKRGGGLEARLQSTKSTYIYIGERGIKTSWNCSSFAFSISVRKYEWFRTTISAIVNECTVSDQSDDTMVANTEQGVRETSTIRHYLVNCYAAGLGKKQNHSVISTCHRTLQARSIT